MNIKIALITQEDIQKAINIEAQSHSPKTVRNSHGLISAVMHVYRPNFALNTALPNHVANNYFSVLYNTKEKSPGIQGIFQEAQTGFEKVSIRKNTPNKEV